MRFYRNLSTTLVVLAPIALMLFFLNATTSPFKAAHTLWTYSPEKRIAYRMPTVLQISQNSILAVVEKREGGQTREGRRTSAHADSGNMSLSARLSTDGGSTWQPEYDLVSPEHIRKAMTTSHIDYSVVLDETTAQSKIYEKIQTDRYHMHLRLADPTPVQLPGQNFAVFFRAQYNTLYKEDKQAWAPQNRELLNDFEKFTSTVRNTYWVARFKVSNKQIVRVSLDRLDETLVPTALRKFGLLGGRLANLHRQSFVHHISSDLFAAHKKYLLLYGKTSAQKVDEESALKVTTPGAYQTLKKIDKSCKVNSRQQNKDCLQSLEELQLQLSLDKSQFERVIAECKAHCSEILQLLNYNKRLSPGRTLRTGTNIEIPSFPSHLTGVYDPNTEKLDLTLMPIPDIATAEARPTERTLDTIQVTNDDGKKSSYLLYSYRLGADWRSESNEASYRRGFGLASTFTDNEGNRIHRWYPAIKDPLIYDGLAQAGLVTVNYQGEEYILSSTNFMRNKTDSERPSENILCLKQTRGKCVLWDNRRNLTITVGKAAVDRSKKDAPVPRLSWYLTHNSCDRSLGPNSAQTKVTSGSAGNHTLSYEKALDPDYVYLIYEGNPDGVFRHMGFGDGVIFQKIPTSEVIDRALHVNRLYQGCKK